MEEDLQNKITKKWIKAYIERPKAALLIDSRLDSVNGVLIAEYLHKKIVHESNSPLIKLDIGEKKSIGIEDIRLLHKTLSLSADKSEGISRIALIDQAEIMTVEAQNALVKLIEDLPERTLVFLVSNNLKNILQTIKSRCFLIPILPIEETSAIDFARVRNISEQDAKKALMLSEGKAELYKDILLNSENSMIANVAKAKKFLQSNVYQRQIIVKSIIEADTTPIQFLNSIKLVAKTGLRSSRTIQQKNTWKSVLKCTLSSEEQYMSNVSAKLVLLNLSMRV